eukprot:12864038-Prorocentrum_lima.AAC.1
MHGLDEKRMNHCEQGRPCWAALFETLERVNDRTGGPRVKVDVLVVGTQERYDVRRDSRSGKERAPIC